MATVVLSFKKTTFLSAMMIVSSNDNSIKRIEPERTLKRAASYHHNREGD